MRSFESVVFAAKRVMIIIVAKGACLRMIIVTSFRGRILVLFFCFSAVSFIFYRH